jgi:hypothetical protein
MRDEGIRWNRMEEGGGRKNEGEEAKNRMKAGWGYSNLRYERGTNIFPCEGI